jgi:hypothetical protein
MEKHKQAIKSKGLTIQTSSIAYTQVINFQYLSAIISVRNELQLKLLVVKDELLVFFYQ